MAALALDDHIHPVVGGHDGPRANTDTAHRQRVPEMQPHRGVDPVQDAVIHDRERPTGRQLLSRLEQESDAPRELCAMRHQ